MKMTLTAQIHHEDGSYWAEVVELPGCFASGDTEADLVEALREAIAMCLGDNAVGSAAPPPVATQMTFEARSPAPA